MITVRFLIFVSFLKSKIILFVSLIKFDRMSESYNIPDLFYNYHAIHYYNQIKKIIVDLDNNRISSDKIIDYLIKYEIERHKNNECHCGESHDLLESNKLRELLTKILDYYYSVNSAYFIGDNIKYQNEYKYLN